MDVFPFPGALLFLFSVAMAVAATEAEGVVEAVKRTDRFDSNKVIFGNSKEIAISKQVLSRK